MEVTSHWGYHLLVDMSGCNANITQVLVIRNFLLDLIHAIDMTAVGDPIIKFLNPSDPTIGAGFSVMQLIETSNITCHFVDHNSTGYIDIFSCKNFDPKVAFNVIENYFAPEAVNTQFILRHAPKI